MTARYHCQLETPLGPLLLVGEGDRLTAIEFPNRGRISQPPADSAEDSRRLRDARAQLDAYFDGRLRRFDLDLDPRGTPFQRKVWSALRRIPYGATISYGDLARRVGNPKASRAVGGANGKNPLPIVIPCHRVIAADGTIGGFGGGLGVKRKLLQLEGAW